jgi:hypothetical protein
VIDAERFWRHIALEDDSRNACWIWIGALRDDGRGRFFVGEAEIPAHRAAYEVIHGSPVPEGRRLEQTCASPQCVRHWRLGERAVKLSEADVESIRNSRLGITRLARLLNVSKVHVLRIRRYEARA